MLLKNELEFLQPLQGGLLLLYLNCYAQCLDDRIEQNKRPAFAAASLVTLFLGFRYMPGTNVPQCFVEDLKASFIERSGNRLMIWRAHQRYMWIIR